MALIKVHVVEMKSNFELQHLRNLPEQAACWVLERGIASCLNDDLEEQDRAKDQLVRLEQLQPMAFSQNLQAERAGALPIAKVEVHRRDRAPH